MLDRAVELLEQADADQPTQVDKIELTQHCVERLQQYCKIKTLSEAHAAFRQVLARSLQVRRKPKFKTIARVLNAARPAWYLSNYVWMVVLIYDRVVTCYPVNATTGHEFLMEDLPDRLIKVYGPDPLIDQIKTGWVWLTAEQGCILGARRGAYRIMIDQIPLLLGLNSGDYRRAEKGKGPIAGKRLLTLMQKIRMRPEDLRLHPHQIYDGFPNF